MMVKLRDIAPLPVRSVNVRGTAVPVPGISLLGAIILSERYPALRVLLEGAGDREQAVMDIMAQGPAVVAAILAAGSGDPGDLVAEENAAALSLDVQFDLLIAVLEETMPDGIGPFGVKVARAFALLAPAEPAGRGRRNSPSSPTGSLPEDEARPTSSP